MKHFSIAVTSVMTSVMAILLFSNALAHHNSPESLEARVAAVGTLNIGSDGAAAGAATSEADSAAAEDGVQDGETVYNTTCAACHASGVAGAPILGAVDDWEERIEQGMDSLVERALLGFTGSSGVMPPKGGNVSLSDDAVTAAVQFMVDQIK